MNLVHSTPHISEKQIKLIWALAHQVGMTYEQLHDMIGLWGKKSIKELAPHEINYLINHFKESGARLKKIRFPRKDLPGNVVEIVTFEQLRYINYLQEKLGWTSNPSRLRGFIKRILKKEIIRTKQEASNVIQGLLKLVDKKGGKINGEIEP